ncbi:MAG: integrase, partial [Proteobacteria bacterium]
MPRAVRVRTDYKGVSYVEKSDERIFYITYRRPESRKLYEEKVGRKSEGWAVARAAAERARRMNGQAQ